MTPIEPDRDPAGLGPEDTDARLHRLYEIVALRDGSPDPFQRLQAICRACMDVLPVTGAGLMLMADRVHQGTLYATDAVIQELEDLQNAAAEGPCIDSYNLGRPILEPDLAGQGLQTWPVLVPSALKAGFRALFSFPLQLDYASVGALNLYRDRPGALTAGQIADARLLAAMATREVLALQATAEPGSLPAQIADLSGDRAAIEQATGMVAAQTNTTVSEAARRLRHEATDRNRALANLAHDIVARRLHLT